MFMETSQVLAILSFAQQTRVILLKKCKQLFDAGSVERAWEVLASIEDIEKRMRQLEDEVRHGALH